MMMSSAFGVVKVWERQKSRESKHAVRVKRRSLNKHYSGQCTGNRELLQRRNENAYPTSKGLSRRSDHGTVSFDIEGDSIA